ncbi:MAG: type I secretion system permease/ATPase [Betaproteobacteria bacterium]|nr:type I secretion system permease/ATPase [Betaproteobacteria bacterium]
MALANPQMLNQKSIIREALGKLTHYFKHTIFFSFFTNLLVLAPTWYMLEVYGRVVYSQNHRTLLMLTMMVILMYVVLEFLEWIRSRIMHEASAKFDQSLNERVFNSIFQAKLKQIPGGTAQAINDLKTIQEAIASPALMGLIDLPFALLTLVLIFAINVTMGWFAMWGAVVLGVIAFINHHYVQPPLTLANRHAIQAQNYASSAIRNAQVIEAMGMLHRIHQKWIEKQQAFLKMQALASDRAGVNSALSKMVQVMQGSILLGIGCWLTLQGELDMEGSMMIVGSILGGRVLTPFVTIVMQWRVLGNAQDAVQRLDQFLKVFPEPQPAMPLPAPEGHLSVEGAVAAPPNSQVAILKGITFRLPAAQSLAIVGPSACGKTTLARLITGIWPAINGKVRLDGADIYAWKKEELGPFVGYLPQDVELFDGTIAENIARFSDVDMAKVKEAAQIVGLDAFISALPQGFDTQVGDEGAFLSGGQRQRVALARAIYGNPKFVVLDEPNSSLDEEGDLALMRTLQYLKSQGTTLIVITHRTQILGLMDYMMVMVDGQIKQFGPRDEVLTALQQQNAPKPSAVEA